MSVQTGNTDLASLRVKIIAAASELYEKKGGQATVEEIAKAAGISIPVTHQFVKKASDIMLLIMEDLQSEFSNRLKPVLDSDEGPEQKLIKAVEAYYRTVDDQRIKVMLVYRASRALDKQGRKRIMQLETEAVDVFQNLLDQGVAAGRFRIADTRLAAYDILVMGHLWSLKSWHFKDRNMTIGHFIDQQLDLILPMVRG